MTDDEIIDKLAELMGWHRGDGALQDCWLDGQGVIQRRAERIGELALAYWNPLENWADAGMVIEKMVFRMGYQEPGFEWLGPVFKPEHRYLDGHPLGTTCWYVRLVIDGQWQLVCSDTAQRAASLAALKACGIEVSE
jgi:hypothetical protein